MTEPKHVDAGPTTSVRVEIAAATHVGLVRDENEDVLVCHGWVTGRSGATHSDVLDMSDGDAPVLYAVADGMGGHDGGAEAAAVTGVVLSRGIPQAGDIAGVLDGADRSVAAVGAALGLDDMGATVGGVVIEHAGVTVFNLGDVRVYRYAGGYLGQQSVDDRVTAPGGGRSYVSQSLGGVERDLAPHVVFQRFEPGTSTYLICSDGLHDVVDTGTVRGVLARGEDPAQAVDSLIRATLQRGAPDNVSIIVLKAHVEAG